MNSIQDLFSSISSSPTLESERRSKHSHTSSHAYVLRVSPSGKDTFYCSLPTCTHCLNIPHQIVGRKSLCQSCMKEFIVGEDKILSCNSCNERELEAINNS